MPSYVAKEQFVFSMPVPEDRNEIRAKRTLFRCRGDGSATAALTPPDLHCEVPRPSPDGAQVAVILVEPPRTLSGRDCVALLDPSTAEIRRLAGPFERPVLFEWLSDSRRLLLWRRGAGGDRVAELIDTESGKSDRVLSEVRTHRMPRVAPSGRVAAIVLGGGSKVHRAVVSELSGTGLPHLVEVDFAAEATVPAWHGGAQVAGLPKGDVLALVDGQDLLLVAPSGESRRVPLRLPHPLGPCSWLTWSGDGQTVFLGWDAGGRPVVYAVDVMTGEARTVIRPPAEGPLSYFVAEAQASPDGDLLLCHLYNDMDVGDTWGVLDVHSGQLVALPWATSDDVSLWPRRRDARGQ
jgi:hypothetical protein